MTDFSKNYRNVKFFGIWAEETADSYGQRDAFNVLIDALKRTRDEDMRKDDVYAALNYLEKMASKPWPFQQFRLALSYPDPEGRWQNMNASLRAIKRAIEER